MRVRANRAKKAIAVVAASALALSLVPVGAVAQVAAQQPQAQEADTGAQGEWWGYFEPVENAVEALKAHSWNVAPGMVPDAESCTAWFEQELAALDLPKVHVRADYSTLHYEAPVNGTADAPQGRPGSFTVKLYVYRTLLDIWKAHEVTVGGTLEPKVYQAPAPDDPGTKEPDGSETKPDEGDQSGSNGETVPGGSTGNTGNDEKPEPPAPSDSDDQKPVTPPDEDDPKPITPPEEDDPDPVTPPAEDDPKPDAPATIEEAALAIEQALAQRKEEDAAALTIGEDELQEDSFDDEASAKAAVTQWVRDLLDKEGIIPEGYSYSLGEPEVKLPTATEAGSFRCPVYLQEEAAGAVHPLALEEAPLQDASRAGAVSAVIGQQPESSSQAIREPDLYIDGTIAPRVVKAANNGGGTGSSASDQSGSTGKHPLAQPKDGRTVEQPIDVINSEEQLEGEDAPRPIKHPNQIDGQERPSSVASTTAVQHDSTIASTADPMTPISRAIFALIGASIVAAALCLTRFRKPRD